MRGTDRTLARLAISLFLGCAVLSAPAQAQTMKPDVAVAGTNARRTAVPKTVTDRPGIWKWAVPPIKMNGMFANNDPIGLVAGKLIPADCSLNWTDPDTHKLYCFSSATSLVYFLDWPQTYLAEAEKNWQALKGKPGEVRETASTVEPHPQ